MNKKKDRLIEITVDGKISAETFVGKVIFYLWNDVFKDFGFDNAIFNDEDGSTLSFDKFYATENGKVIVRKDKVELFLKIQVENRGLMRRLMEQ